MKEQRKAFVMLVSSMLIFGTIGIFRKYIPLSSALLAFVRGTVGSLFLYACIKIKGKKLKLNISRKSLILLMITGVFLGLNWILLFEAYNYTKVSVATLCYYMAPTIVILASPVLFKEKLGLRKIICAVVALVGMVLVTGVTEEAELSLGDIRGIVFGLAAALLYAFVVILNKKNPVEDAYSKTVVQLVASAVVLIPYLLLTENISSISLTPFEVVMVILVGILHTGIAYLLYFGSIDALKSQTAAVLSYIDPVSALILAALILGESMSPIGIVGAVLVIGATLASEFLS